MTIKTDLDEAVAKAQAAAQILHDVANGAADSSVVTLSGSVPSVAKLIGDIEADFAAAGVVAAVAADRQGAEDAAAAAGLAQVAAEDARDVAVAAVAAIVDPLLAENNLSDLASAATARANLNVYSKSEVDALSSAGPLQSDIDALKTNLAMTLIRMIANAGSSYMGMVDGWADEFENTTGIGSLGTATYDTTGDYIHNPAPSSNVFAGVVPTCNVGIEAGSLSNTSNGVTNSSDFVQAAGAMAGNFRLRFDCGVGADHKPTKFRQWFDGTSQAPGNFNLYGSSTGAFSGEEFLIASGAYSNVSGWQEHTFSAPATGARVFEVRSTTSVNAGNPSNNPLVFEMELIVPSSAPNVTVTSIVKTADAIPERGRVTLVVDPQVAITYGADNSIRMSRDGGTTWVTGAMATEATNLDFPGSYTVDVVTASFDFTGTPAGTSMKLEWSTFNNKHQLLHAWYPEWRE